MDIASLANVASVHRPTPLRVSLSCTNTTRDLTRSAGTVIRHRLAAEEKVLTTDLSSTLHYSQANMVNQLKTDTGGHRIHATEVPQRLYDIVGEHIADR